MNTPNAGVTADIASFQERIAQLMPASEVLAKVVKCISVDRPENGPYRDKLCLFYKEPDEGMVVLVASDPLHEVVIDRIADLLYEAKIALGTIKFDGVP